MNRRNMMKKKKTFFYLCLGALICAGTLVGVSVADLTTHDPADPAHGVPEARCLTDTSWEVTAAAAEEGANTSSAPLEPEVNYTGLVVAEAEDSRPLGTGAAAQGAVSNTAAAAGMPEPEWVDSNLGPKVLSTGLVSPWTPASEGSRALTFDLTPGDGPPPDTLGGYAMTPFEDDPRPLSQDVWDVPSPCPTGGQIDFSIAMNHRKIGSGWMTWSHGYTGDVYYTNGATSISMMLPAGSCAFYFYVEPNPFNPIEFTAVGDDGTSSGTFTAHGSAGAVYVGIYGEGLQWVGISTDDGVTDFAVGEFGLACYCEPVFVACCQDQTGDCVDGVPLIECIEQDGRWDIDVFYCDDLVPLCGELVGACCCSEYGEAGVCEPYECIADMFGGECLALGEETSWHPAESCEEPLPYGCGAPGLLYAPSNPDNPAFRDEVSALIGRTVDYFDPRGDTPTLEELQEYIAVFTWANYAYADPVAMGDVLADFVDVGGRVILGQWCLPTAGNYLSGRIMTEGYCPATASFYSTDSYAGDGVFCPTMGVESFASSYFDQTTTLEGAWSDGTTANGYDFVSYQLAMNVYYSPGNTGIDYTTGDVAQLTANMVICPPGELYGACCHPIEYGVPPGEPGFSGLCEDNVALMDCLPPLKFHWEEQCAELDPLCGDPGCCCYPEEGELLDPYEELALRCGGRHLSAVLGDDCHTYAFEPDPCGLYTVCEHSITMWDDYGDGWNGGTIDVFVDGELVLDNLTLASGSGPGYAYFDAGTGAVIETVWTPGGWPYECSYCIYDLFDLELGCDGLGGVDPTGITVTGNCEPPAGACCMETDGCEVLTPIDCELAGGLYLGHFTDCGDQADCDGDGETDLCAIVTCPEEDVDCQDCNENGIPDSCDIDSGFSTDCQPNGIPDECEDDCNGNGIADECDIADCGGPESEPQFNPDCWGDQYYWWCEDCQADGIPDVCQLGGEGARPDANVLLYSEYDQGPNIYQYTLDLLGWDYTMTIDHATFAGHLGAGGWTHVIVNHSNSGGTGFVWEAPLVAYLEGNPDVIAIVADWRVGYNPPYLGSLGFSYGPMVNFYSLTPGPGDFFADNPPADLVNQGWGIFSTDTAGGTREATAADGNGAINRSEVNPNWFFFGPIGDSWEPDMDVGFEYVTDVLEQAPPGADCNGNCIPDDCDILYCDEWPPEDQWMCADCQPDGVPDGCEPDCNGNQIADECDIRDCDPDDPDCQDCNGNEIPDWCDIEFCPEGFEFAVDCDDCNENGVPDWCDIDSGFSTDCNDNGIPDDCESMDDCDGDGIPDICDPDCNEDGVSDVCEMLWCGGPLSEPHEWCPEGNEYAWCDDCNDDGVLDGWQAVGSAARSADDIMYAPSNPDDAGFRTATAAITGGLVVYYDARYGTPTVDEMLEYGTVYTWANYAYSNNVAMGNNLADYADAGGKVILGQWCLPTAGNYLSGRIMDVAEGYLPCTATSYGGGDYAGDGTGCFTEEVVSYSTSYRDNVTLVEGAENDGTYTDGTPFACYGMNPQVMLGAGYLPGYSTGDIAQMVANGHNCLGGGAGCPPGAGDCNENCIPDDCDIADCGEGEGWEWCQDCQEDGIPDGCQLDPDCQGDLIPDDCQLEGNDCNENGIPDDCDIADCGECLEPCDENAWCQDCQGDGIPDECQLKERPFCCGDGYCAPSEDCASCPEDCGVCPFCGDGICQPEIGETCLTCPEDCGECPECADFIVTAPGSFSGDTCGAGYDCPLRPDTPEHIYQVTIPEDGTWVFSLCDGTTTWDTYMFLGTTCCDPGDEIASNDDFCGLQSQITWDLEAGTYYCTIEGYCCDQCGFYTLDVYSTGGGGGDSDCCYDHCAEGAGCDDAECEAIVCGMDPFCCDVCWDSLCAEEAMAFCEVCAGSRDDEALISQPPNQINGLFSDCTYAYTVAENFLILEDVTVETLRVWGGLHAGDSTPEADAFHVYFYDDAGGMPGTLIAQYAPITADELEQTGIVLFGVHEWVVTFNLSPGVELTPGTYYVAVAQDSVYTSDIWFWEVGDYDTETGVPNMIAGAGCPPSFTGVSIYELAFELFGYSGPTINDCNTNCVPDECDLDCDGNCIPDDCEEGSVGCGSLIIKGGACPAPFNRKSQGVTPMWLVGTEFFDVTDIDLSSLRLVRADGLGGALAPLDGPPGPGMHFEDMCQPYVGEGPCACLDDISVDGIMDLKLKFSSPDMTEVLELYGVAGELVELVIIGDALSPCAAQSFTSGVDCMRFVHPFEEGGALGVGVEPTPELDPSFGVGGVE